MENNIALNKAIKKYSKNIIFVSYPQGYGGHLVCRIISASPEIYFDSDPLFYPNNCEGFPSLFYDSMSSERFKAEHLCAVDTNHGTFPYFNATPEKNIQLRENLQYFMSNLKKDRVLCIPTHDENIHKEFEGRVVRIVGELNRYTFFSVKKRQPLQPINNKNVINLSLSKLTSNNYKEFEEEYLQLCYFLNIFPQINSVRAFILLWAEKQRRYEND